MSVEYSSLRISGFGDEPVPNELIRQRPGLNTLAVFLPGRWYTCDMPLFYFAERLMVERGWDVLRVQFDYRQSGEPVSEDEQLKRLAVDSQSAVNAGMADGTYRRVVLVGKSIGTIAMAQVLPALEAVDTWSVWLTPLLKRPDVLECVMAGSSRSLVVIGSEDFQFDPVVIDALARDNGCAIVVIDGGEHSLNLKGDAAASAMSVVTAIHAMNRFLPDNHATIQE